MSGFHAGALELYVPRKSAAHRWSARTRVLLVFAFLVAVAATRAVPTAWAILAGILLAACMAARLSPLLILRRALVALPFLVAAVPLAFVGPPGRYESICATAVLSVAAAAWLAATTRFPDLARAMAQLGVPRVLVSVAVMAWRYLFVLTEEVGRMLRARALRAPLGMSPRQQAVSAGRMAGSLMLRALERSERVYGAMRLRGFDPQ